MCSAEKDAELSFLLNHPQAVYDAELAPQAQNALIAPLRISPNRWLRIADGVLAARFRRLAAAMRNAETVGGEPVRGLSLEIGDLKAAIGSANSFYVVCKIRNVRPYPQYVYSGFRNGLGIRLRPVLTNKENQNFDPEARPRRTVFLFPADEEQESQWGLEDPALETGDDFTALLENEVLSHDLQVTTENRPELRALKGRWLASVFYWTDRTGERAADLPRRAWTGIVFSKELPMQFGDYDSKAGTR
jgi:hypothetical protein